MDPTVLLIGSGAYILRIFFNKNLLPVERRGVSILLILFPFATLFWAALALSGFSLLFLAGRYTGNTIFGHHIPTAWWQSVGAVLIVLLSPVMGFVWLKLGRREPAFSLKFVLSFILTGLAFLVLCAAALQLTPDHTQVKLSWLFLMCVLGTLGELCLSPIGLSMVTRLAPAGAASQLMGMWFLTVAIGNVLGGQAVGLLEKVPLPRLFGGASLCLFGAAIILALLASTIGRLSSGLK